MIFNFLYNIEPTHLITFFVAEPIHPSIHIYLRKCVHYVRYYNSFPNHTTLLPINIGSKLNEYQLDYSSALLNRILNSSSSLQLISDCDKRNHG